MKLHFTFFILISNLALFAQSKTIIGDYELSLPTEKGDLIEYKLTLNTDGIFFFNSYSKIIGGDPTEVIQFGRGNWTEKNAVVSFFSNNKKDFDTKFTLDFTNTKARFITKSLRDKTDKIVKTKFQFLDSEINWINKIEMFQI